MPNIFISYRRSDTTTGYASWIYESLVGQFGEDSVFMDIDSLSLGTDFIEQLEKYAAKADAALILIGPGWLNATDKNGTRRLDDPIDIVRLEVAAVLRSHIRVIPILVDGAEMPEAAALPSELRALVRRHALVFDRRGGTGFRDLIATLREIDRQRGPQTTHGKGSPSSHQEPGVVAPASPAAPRGRPRRRLVLTAAGIVVVLIAAGMTVWLTTRSGTSSSKSATQNPIMKILTGANNRQDSMAKNLIPPSKCKAQGARKVTCSHPAGDAYAATFTTYPTLHELYANYQEELNKLGDNLRLNWGKCGPPHAGALALAPGESGWNHDEQHPRRYNLKQSKSNGLDPDTQLAGRLFCTVQGPEFIVWTENDRRLLGVVRGHIHDVYTWWYNVHHEIAGM